MKGIREVCTTEQLYNSLRPRLCQSDAWLAQQHPNLMEAADAMVEALQKKESYGGGVAQRAAHLAAHLKATDPVLAEWLERQTAADNAAAAASAAAAEAGAGATPGVADTEGGTAGAGAAAGVGVREGAAAEGGGGGAVENGSASPRGDPGAEGGKGSEGDKTASSPGKRAIKGPPGAATALEYLTTTFAHLREQRTLVMGDKKDRLLREVAGLRQLRAGHVNVLRGARAGETSMGDLLAALKEADADYVGGGGGAGAGGAGVAPMEVDGQGVTCGPAAGSGSGGGGGSTGRGALDNMTCVVWEDWRIPERLDTLLRAGDSVSVYVEVHCRDGPEDYRLAMRLTTFVALALCSQRLIAELYQDMFISPQRAAAARPQRQKRQRTEAEETVQSLDESPDSLDFVDFVEALHRRMPLRCGWMYANAIMPSAGEWDRVFGRKAGRLSGLYDGGSELDALGRACLAFHHTRHESPVLDVHALASRLRVQHAAGAVAAAAALSPAGAEQHVGCGTGGDDGPDGAGCCCGNSPKKALQKAMFDVAVGKAGAAAAASPSLLVRHPADSSGRGQGLDLGHLSCCCVTAAPLADDFLGELIRQTTAGQVAAEVAVAAATAAALRASKCEGNTCSGKCVEDAAAAATAAAAAAAATAALDPSEAEYDEQAEEEDLFEAVVEELLAVEESAQAAEKEDAATGKALSAVENAASGRSATCTGGLKGAFSHRMQLMPGVFFSYYIGSQAFTNTAWHVEDFLLQSINLMLVGRPKAWWWVPRDKEEVFKEYLEEQWETEDIYTKSVPLAAVPLEKLIKMGIRRSVQLPGAYFITSPGYAFHTTMSSGWSMADSANFMTNIVGKDMHVLESERPLEQYPETEGRSNTGEWVRFTMRRIEQLRAANDPTYVPRPVRRSRSATVPTVTATKAPGSKTGGGAGGTGGSRKAEPKVRPQQDDDEAHLLGGNGSGAGRVPDKAATGQGTGRAPKARARTGATGGANSGTVVDEVGVVAAANQRRQRAGGSGSCPQNEREGKGKKEGAAGGPAPPVKAPGSIEPAAGGSGSRSRPRQPASKAVADTSKVMEGKASVAAKEEDDDPLVSGPVGAKPPQPTQPQLQPSAATTVSTLQPGVVVPARGSRQRQPPAPAAAAAAAPVGTAKKPHVVSDDDDPLVTGPLHHHQLQHAHHQGQHHHQQAHTYQHLQHAMSAAASGGAAEDPHRSRQRRRVEQQSHHHPQQIQVSGPEGQEDDDPMVCGPSVLLGPGSRTQSLSLSQSLPHLISQRSSSTCLQLQPPISQQQQQGQGLGVGVSSVMQKQQQGMGLALGRAPSAADDDDPLVCGPADSAGAPLVLLVSQPSSSAAPGAGMTGRVGELPGLPLVYKRNEVIAPAGGLPVVMSGSGSEVDAAQQQQHDAWRLLPGFRRQASQELLRRREAVASRSLPGPRHPAAGAGWPPHYSEVLLPVAPTGVPSGPQSAAAGVLPPCGSSSWEGAGNGVVVARRDGGGVGAAAIAGRCGSGGLTLSVQGGGSQQQQQHHQQPMTYVLLAPMSSVQQHPYQQPAQHLVEGQAWQRSPHRLGYQSHQIHEPGFQHQHQQHRQQALAQAQDYAAEYTGGYLHHQQQPQPRNYSQQQQPNHSQDVGGHGHVRRVTLTLVQQEEAQAQPQLDGGSASRPQLFLQRLLAQRAEQHQQRVAAQQQQQQQQGAGYERPGVSEASAAAAVDGPGVEVQWRVAVA